MEEEQEQKVGAGIWTIAIINFVIYGLSLIGDIAGLAFKDKLDSAIKQSGVKPIPTSVYIIGIVVSILILVSVLLILLKNTIGVIAFFVINIADIIYGIVQNGFKPLSLVGLILPVLMAIFVYQKRTIFKISRGEEE
jgi:hypothetical protein